MKVVSVKSMIRLSGLPSRWPLMAVDSLRAVVRSRLPSTATIVRLSSRFVLIVNVEVGGRTRPDYVGLVNHSAEAMKSVEVQQRPGPTAT